MNVNTLRSRVVTWFVGLLAAALVAFGAALYFGVQEYLKTTLQQSLSAEAAGIGATFLFDEEQKGASWMASEIAEAYAPELSGRFIRVTRQDDKVLYQSGDTRDTQIHSSSVTHAALGAGNPFFREESHDKTRHLVVYTLPYKSPSGTRYLIETGASLFTIEHVLSSLLRMLILITPLILFAAAVGGRLLMKLPLRPLVNLAERAEHVGLHHLGERLPVYPTGDEMERLSLSLNRMIGRLEDALSHNRRFSADVSHVLRTPLTILRGELEQVVQIPALPIAVQEPVGSALEEIDRMVRVIESLLAISRMDSGTDLMERQLVDFSLLAISTTDQMHLLAEEKQIDLLVEADPTFVLADPGRITQVLVNLIDNAVKYTPDGGVVTVTVASEGPLAILAVTDTGIGIPQASLPYVFDRFYRSDKARSRVSGGAGLGLSIVQAIVNAHGGDITLESTEGVGTTVRLALPLCSPSALAVSRLDRSSPPSPTWHKHLMF